MVGDDAKGIMLVSSLTDLGLKNYTQVKKGERTACFNGFLDAEGNFKLGVADMEILEEVDIEHLKKCEVHESDILVMDGNLSPASIESVMKYLGETKWP